jgi:hypothetical protein
MVLKPPLNLKTYLAQFPVKCINQVCGYNPHIVAGGEAIPDIEADYLESNVCQNSDKSFRRPVIDMVSVPKPAPFLSHDDAIKTTIIRHLNNQMSAGSQDSHNFLKNITLGAHFYDPWFL